MSSKFQIIIFDYLNCIKSRKVVFIVYSWTALMGLLVNHKGIPPIGLVVPVFVSISLVGLAVYLYNDILDYDDDISVKEYGYMSPSTRPLVSGKTSKDRMKYYIIFNALLGLGISYSLNIQVFSLMILYIVLGILYSTEPFRLKRIMFAKQLVVSLGIGIASLLGGFASNYFSPGIIFFAFISSIMAYTVNPILDLKDLKVDRAVGIKTVPVLWGPKFTVRLAIISLMAGMAAFILGYQRFGFNTAFPILGSISIIGLIVSIYPLQNNWKNKEVL